MISLVGATDAGGFVTEVTVDLPAGVEDGDRLLLLASANDMDQIVSAPSGWAVLTEDEIGTDVSTYVLTRTADSEPADYTVTWEGEHWHFLNLLAFRNVEAIRSYEVASDDPVSTVDLPVLQAEDGDALVAFGFNDEETSKSWPGALTEITNLARGIISAWQSPGVGPTDAHTLTAGTAGHMAATAILLAPQEEADPAIGIPIQLRAQLQLSSGEWTEISDDVRAGGAGEVSIRRGRQDEASTADTSSCGLRLDNADGRYSPRNPASPYFGVLRRNTPFRVGVASEDGETVYWRFAGEVAEWPVRWEAGDVDVTVPIEAAGPLRRLGQGSAPDHSPLRRFIGANDPVSYWPITDGQDAVLAAPDVGRYDMSVVSGPHPGGNINFVRVRLDWQSGDLAPWLENVAKTVGEFGRIVGRVPTEDASTEWSIDMVRAGPGGRDRLVAMTTSDSSGTVQEWRVRLDHATTEVRVSIQLTPEDDAPPGFTMLDNFVDERFFVDQLRHVRLRVTDAGSECDWALYVDGALMISGTTSGFGAPRPLDSAQYWWNLDESIAPDGEHSSIGHITVWDEQAEPAPPTALDVTDAMYGHTGERSGVRIQRILQEEGIGFQAVGDLEQTVPVGPQQTASPLDVIRDAEQADDGVLYEARDEVALVYRTNRSRYNQGGSA